MNYRGARALGVILCACSVFSSVRGQDFIPLSATEQEKYGMPSAAERRLIDNDFKLKVSLSLDRSVYLPGESAVATIVVENPTLTTLEAHEPFKDRGPDSFQVMTQADNKFVFGSTECCSTKWPDGQTHIYAAGEKIQRSFQPWGGGRIFIIPNPGQYTLFYTFGSGAAANFSVVAAEVVAEGYAPLRKQGSGKEGDRAVAVPMQVTLAVLRADGKHYVVASRGAGREFLRDAQNRVWLGRSALGPYVRIAESATPIVEVSAEEIVGNVNEAAPEVGKEKLRVRWKQADGKQSAVNLGPDRKPVQ